MENQKGSLKEVEELIRREFREGLRHGHSFFSVTIEPAAAHRRRVIVHAGKSYQFFVPAEEWKAAA